MPFSQRSSDGNGANACSQFGGVSAIGQRQVREGNQQKEVQRSQPECREVLQHRNKGEEIFNRKMRTGQKCQKELKVEKQGNSWISLKGCTSSTLDNK